MIALDTLNPLERRKLLLLGGIALAFVLLVLSIFIFAVVKNRKVEKNIVTQKRYLRELQEVAPEYLYLKQRGEYWEERLSSSNEPLLSYLENICKTAQIEKPSLSPKRTGTSEYYEENSVELKATKINLEQLLNLLRNIETSQRYLRIKTFKVETPYSAKDLLDVTMQISSYSPKTTTPTQPAEGTPPQ